MCDTPIARITGSVSSFKDIGGRLSHICMCISACMIGDTVIFGVVGVAGVVGRTRSLWGLKRENSREKKPMAASATPKRPRFLR